MAFNFTHTSSQYLSTASTPVTINPMTIVGWGKITENILSSRPLVSVGDAGGVNRNQISFRIASGGSLVEAVSADSTATSVAVSSLAYTLNTWHHVAGVFSSNASRTVFLDGGNEGTNTANRNMSDADSVVIGARWNNSLIFFAGPIAEVGIWNAALTADEIASLAKGMTCDKIRPQSLVFYAPLVRDLIDTKGGLTITNNNGATVADHPRVYS
jgi:hypothetical protein